MLSLVCCAVPLRYCHMLFYHIHILYSPVADVFVADVFGGRDDTS